MAKAASDPSEVDELAFRLYSERIAKMPAQVSGEESSRWAYRRAEEFLSVRDKVRAGEELRDEGPKLSEVSAPNLKPTHPHNIISKRFGDLAKARAAYEFLKKHPHSDEEPVTYAPLDWDAATVKLARQVLPHYCN